MIEIILYDRVSLQPQTFIVTCPQGTNLLVKINSDITTYPINGSTKVHLLTDILMSQLA